MPHAAGGARRPLRALRRRAATRRGAALPPLAPPPGPARRAACARRMRERSGRAAGGGALGAWPPGAARCRAARARQPCAQHSARAGSRAPWEGAGAGVRASCLGGQPPRVTSVLGSYDITPRPSVRCRPRNACARGARSAQARPLSVRAPATRARARCGLLCARAAGAAGAPRMTLPGAAPAACRWRGGRVCAAPAPAAALRAGAWAGRWRARWRARRRAAAWKRPRTRLPKSVGREGEPGIPARIHQGLHVRALPPPPPSRPRSLRAGRAGRPAHQVEPDAGGRGEHDGARDHADEAHAQARHRQDHEDNALCAARARPRLATTTLSLTCAAGRRRAGPVCSTRWRCARCRRRSAAGAA
jgi:hypothetical protein